ncbi:unnamed protein product [Rhizopus stolonifer]
MLSHTLFLIAALFFTLTSSAALPNLLNPNTLKNKLKLFTGLSTYYEVGPGSCGEYDDDSELVVALNIEQMNNGLNPNSNPNCEQSVYISGNHGNTRARIVDTCPHCPTGTLDMSPTVFQIVCGPLSPGLCAIRWNFVKS